MADDLEGWLDWILDPLQYADEDEPMPAHACFPTDELFGEYLDGVSERSEAEVKELLRRMLSAVTAVGDTAHHQMTIRAIQDKQIPHDRYDHSEWYHRLVWRQYVGMGEAWDGMSWVLERLPFAPGQVLQALELYLLAQHSLPDDRIRAFEDAMAIIRARWIGTPTSNAGRIGLLNTLSARQFEGLIAALWRGMGYEVELTPASRDGGYDLRAAKVAPDHRDVALVECKSRTSKPVGVEVIRALKGILDDENSVRGVVVTSSRFTRGARGLADYSPRLELIDGNNLLLLLNEHVGWDWPKRMELLIRTSLQVSG